MQKRTDAARRRKAVHRESERELNEEMMCVCVCILAERTAVIFTEAPQQEREKEREGGRYIVNVSVMRTTSGRVLRCHMVY